MAVLQVLSTVLLLVCWGALQTHGQLGMSLNGQAIANNSIVLLRNIGEGDGGALLCTTDRTACCTGALGRAGEWFYPDGRRVPIMDPPPPATAEPYYRNRGTSLIRLNRRINQGLSDMYTGVYCCEIPDQNNVIQTLCVGAYLTESAGVPSISELTFSATTRTLTCISMGGPATTVTWRLGGSELTVDGSMYQFMQTLTEESTSTYTNVLTIISTNLNTIIGSNFTCEVENSRGRAAMNITIPSPTPPRMFQIISVMSTSFNFSWQRPLVLNGVLAGYQLSCQPLLPGIPLSQTLTPGSTAVMAMLSGLYPGVMYNCSIVARNDYLGPSDPVYISNTTEETVPTGPPQNFSITPRVRNMTFFWSPPISSRRNGVITSYSLSCVSEAGGGSSISMQYTAAGTSTLRGFTPATSYNCSISASNSQGSGPPKCRVVVTMDDAMLFQLQLSGTGLRDCQEWVGVATNSKLNDIANRVVQNINRICQCGVSAELITEGAFQCFRNSDHQVTFRARLRGTAQITSSQLLAYLEMFVVKGDSSTTIAVQGVCLDVDNSCPVAINSFSDPQCISTTMTPQSDNTAAIIGGVVAVIVVVAVTVIIAIAVIVRKCCRSRFTFRNAREEPAKLGEIAKPGNEGITTIQCDAYELINLGDELKDLSEYQNTEYEIPIKECPANVLTRKSED